MYRTPRPPFSLTSTLCLWYFSSIIAMPPRIASTLTTPYTRQTPNPCPLTTSHPHLMPWAPSYPTQRCHFCRRPCQLLPSIATSLPILAVFATHNAQRHVVTGRKSPLNSALERRTPQTQNEKAAKTAMFTIPVNIAAPSSYFLTPLLLPFFPLPPSSVCLRVLCGDISLPLCIASVPSFPLCLFS